MCGSDAEAAVTITICGGVDESKRKKVKRKKRNKVTWYRYFDKSRSLYYYYETKSQQTSWDLPTDAIVRDGQLVIFLRSFTLNGGSPLLKDSDFDKNGDYSKESIRECVGTAIKGEDWCDTKETGCDLNDLKKAIWDKRYASCSVTKQNEQRQATSGYDVNDDNVHINHQRFKQVKHQHLRNK